MKSNEPAKTKKTMKTMKKYLSMVALALVGALMTGCSSDDNEPQQPANTGNVETLTLTVSLDGEGTRALTYEGVKTFAAGDQIAVVYKNTSNETVKTVSNALSVGGSTATFTVTVEDADKGEDVTYIYPAAMAKDNGDINYDALATQDGTLATLSSNLDLATYTGAWSGTSLPSNVDLDNPLAILQLTLTNSDGSSTITNTITGMTISDGTNSYTVSRSAADGPIYVAIQPTSSANIEVTATDGTANYTKSLTGKTYAAGNFYNHGWRMEQLCSYTAPTLNTTTATYSGSAQAFVTAGSATGGTVYYKVDYTNKSNQTSYGEWSTSVPSATNAGNYTVYYKVVPDDGYTGGVESTSLGTKTINKANGWCSLSPNSSSGWKLQGSTTSASASISHHGGALSYSKGGAESYRIGYLNVSISGNTLYLSRNDNWDSCTDNYVIVTSAATNNYNAASARYTCNY